MEKYFDTETKKIMEVIDRYGEYVVVKIDSHITLVSIDYMMENRKRISFEKYQKKNIGENIENSNRRLSTMKYYHVTIKVAGEKEEYFIPADDRENAFHATMEALNKIGFCDAWVFLKAEEASDEDISKWRNAACEYRLVTNHEFYDDFLSGMYTPYNIIMEEIQKIKSEGEMSIRRLMVKGLINDETEITVHDGRKILAVGNWYNDNIVKYIRTEISAFTWNKQGKLLINIGGYSDDKIRCSKN